MQKPKYVNLAVMAIWATFIFSAAIAIIDRQTGAMTSGEFTGALFFTAILCIVPYKISAGKNWARYAYAVAVALTTAMMFAGESAGVTKLALIFSWLSLPIEGWILYCLFRRESGEWFEARALAKN